METDPERLRTVLVTDCGSTTTKALLFERREEGWRQTARGEAPTTVEAPVADVTVGARNAFIEVEELSGRRILSGDDQKPFLITAQNPGEGIDLYLSTSSAGGGLQMMVIGAVKEMTTESAQRAALGAGAIVMDAISADDGREDHERIDRIRHIKPDIVLLTGGVDGGSKTHVVEMAETLVAAAPRPRFGSTLKLPVIYAGNSSAAEEVLQILGEAAQVSVVANVRPSLDQENITPAREAIHELFLKHVMSHSPGYGKLMSWSPLPIMPTPAAVGDVVQSYAESRQLQLLCADIGGATTDVFSVFCNMEGEPIFNRTVSANFGMSYSIANVLVEAGVDVISRWLPFVLNDFEIRDRLRNKMIRPTSIPQTKEDLALEQAVCREALRLSLEHHRSLAVGLSGVQQQRGIADIFAQHVNRYELVDMMKLDLVIGSGGVLSHAPNRLEAALMMMEGFGLQGFTQLAVDSIFMMPHLGVLSAVHPQAAQEIFVNDCLVNIGYAVVPVYPSKLNRQRIDLAQVIPDGGPAYKIKSGDLTIIPANQSGRSLRIHPLRRDVDVGAGRGVDVVRDLQESVCGVILDGRNRPIQFSPNPAERSAEQERLYSGLGVWG